MKRLLLLFVLLPFIANAQDSIHYTGCIFNKEDKALAPVKARQLTRSYKSLPPRASLVQYCPTPESQGQYGTCTSWAIAYAARTIMEAKKNGWTNPTMIKNESFSPTFVYTKIKNSDDYNCQHGSSIYQGLKLLRDEGIPKKSTFFNYCANYIPAIAEKEAANYKIKDFYTLFWEDDNSAYKIETTKMAISQGRPVIVAMDIYNSFDNATTVWNGVTDYKRGSHAMCVVGYDDDLYGGAFRIMNSWGTYWGDNGFIWIKYKDFGIHMECGYEMFLGHKKKTPKSPTLSGSMKIKLATKGYMSAKLTWEDYRYIYHVEKKYPSGTRYRILLSNNEPAYVYVIGADMSGSLDLLFPPNKQTSPALVYASNNIAIPDEKWYIEMDNTVGTDYLCVLYSQEELPIDDILMRISVLQGTFPNKIYDVLGVDAAPNYNVKYESSSIAFSTSSEHVVVPIIVEIPHGK